MAITHNIKTTVTAGITFWHCLFCWRQTKSLSTIKGHMSIEHPKEWAAAQKGEDDETNNDSI